jgi:glycosyltransferase involved in cell wall biosynthesis
LNLSIVIVCKNEADIIGDTLQSVQGITDDIVVFDNGSTDSTKDIVRKFNAALHEGKWQGFGKTKKMATSLAKYDWVLSLDADEAIDSVLKQSILSLPLNNENTAFEIRFRNFLGKKHLKYGEWGRDKHIRLFNRRTVNWDDAHVHEELIIPRGVAVERINGSILHRTMKDMKEYSEKMVKYAMLNAEKYFQQGKKASWFGVRLSPGFTFLNYYILKLGFLDGREGYVCARMTAYYTFLKYSRLRELWATNS